MLRTISFFAVIALLLVGVWFGITQNRTQIINQENVEEEIFDSEEIEEQDIQEQQDQVESDTNENSIKTPTDTELQAHTWIWKETQMNDGTTITPNQPDAFSVTFTKEGNLSGQTDCNGFGGSYTTNQGQISFGPFMSTLMYCEDSQEDEFVKMVTESTSYMFDSNDNLVLLIKYDSGSVLFEKE